MVGDTAVGKGAEEAAVTVEVVEAAVATVEMVGEMTMAGTEEITVMMGEAVATMAVMMTMAEVEAVTNTVAEVGE